MNANELKNGLPSEANDYLKPHSMDVDGTIESDWKEVEHNFNEMNLKEELMHGISVYGLEKLSAIQQRAILPCIKGQDVIVQAQSGTGKTATFSISILQQIDTSLNECQALILVPTCELAREIQKVVIALGNFMKADCHACIGKTNIYDNMHTKLNTVSHVVVGTPDHVYDMIVRKSLLTQFIKIFVLDEADEILSHGFKDQITKVLECLEENIQVILWSATMSEDVLNLTMHFMCNPVFIHRQKGKDNIKDSCNVPTAVTMSDDIANQKKLAEFVKKVLHNDLPKEMMGDEWPSCSLIKSKQSVENPQQDIQDIIIDKSALIYIIKSRYARQMENLSVCEQHQHFWLRKYNKLVNYVNTTRDKLKRLNRDPIPNLDVKHVRNVGINACPTTICKETAILNEITIL